VAALIVSAPHVAAAQAAARTAVMAPDYTPADVAFMRAMISHNGQAVVMAVMATSHGASAPVAEFCKKLMVTERDEIRLMQGWLKERGQPVPESMPSKRRLADQDTISPTADELAAMPGMPTPTQMKQLEQARGAQWDRLFLAMMLRHHEGALSMAQTLFESPGGGQGEAMFGYANALQTGLRNDIDRMQDMSAALKVPGSRSPAP
jgi:uncharacterized protein (DUF305 family)